MKKSSALMTMLATCFTVVLAFTSCIILTNDCEHIPNADDGDCTTPITCSVCGTTTTPANDNHTGGIATCTDKAICTVCDTAYGTVDATNHIDSNTDHICDRECGTTDIGTHVDKNKDHNCDYGCLTSIGTHADSENDNDHLCDYGCGVTLEDCKGGTATCVSGKSCEICGVEYDTTKNPDNHASEAATYIFNDNESHRKIHECGILINEAEAHTFVDGKCVCGLMEIAVDTVSVTPWATEVTGNDQRTWEQGDSFTLHLFNQDDPTKTEVHTVTYDGEKWSMPISSILPAYFVAYIGDGVTVTSPTEYSVESFEMSEDQSDADKLKAADIVIASGTVSGDAALDLLFEHHYAKVTFNVVLASQFNPDTDVISEFYVVTCDGDYVKPYIDGNSYTALVPANPYFTAGVHFALVTINGELLEIEIPAEYANPNGSLIAGTHYTFNRKIGKDKISVEQFSMTDIDSPFGDGWHNEIDLKAIGTQDVGKTAWEIGDQIIVTFTSPRLGTQYGTLTYDGTVWSTDVSFSYLEDETLTVSAIYAPCYEVVDGNIQLKDGMQLGMTEYLVGECEIENGTISISFKDTIRDYSRLRIIGLPNQTLTVITTDFFTAGVYEEAIEPYTLTTDKDGNAYLYGIFAEGATVSVKKGDVTLSNYTFTADTEPNVSYALETRPIIDSTLGGKTTATEEDITALVEQLKNWVDNGITTITVTGETPAMYNLLGSDLPAVSAAIFFLGSSGSTTNGDRNSPYCGTIDLIMPDATSLAYMEFCSTYALNSVTLPKVTKIADRAFYDTPYLRTITFGSVLTEVNESGGVMFAQVGKEVDGCDLILNCGQMNENSVPAPDLTTNTWKFMFKNEFKSITLTHTGECDECKANQ